jgi:hypothetical protein
MTMIIFVKCSRPDCTSIQPTDATTVVDARMEVRGRDWSSRQVYTDTGMVTEDLCPTHMLPLTNNSAADLYNRTPRDECSTLNSTGHCTSMHARTTASQKDTMGVYDWCGHDNLGHRMGNALIRARYTSVTAITRATEQDIMDVPGLGRAAMTRWKHFMETDHAA